MMNSQSCTTRSGFDPIPTSAGPIERAGLTEVPVMLMPTRWMTTKRQADGEAGEAGRRERVRDAENADQEQEGRNHLEDEGRNDVVFAEVARAPAVLAKPAIPSLSLAGQDEIEHDRGDDRPEHLGDPVTDHLLGGHAAGDEHAEADRRIDVAARDGADAVGHGDDGKAEGAGDPEQIDGRGARPHSPDDRRSAPEEHQGEGADKFRNLLIHCTSPPMLRPISAQIPLASVTGRSPIREIAPLMRW